MSGNPKMSRCLGPNQLAVVEAMAELEHKRGSAWLRPADVLARLPSMRMDLRTHSLGLTLALIEARTAAAKGDAKAARRAARLERAGVSPSWKSSTFTVSPGVKIPGRITGGHRTMNLARIFDALAKRGIVERQARPGPGSRVRLIPEARVPAV